MLSWVRRALTRRLGLKLFALTLSVGVFVLMRGGDMRSRSMYVGLEATLPGPESGKQLVSELPDRVQIVLTGRWPLIDSARPRDPIEVDLSEMQPFHFIDPSTLGLPAVIKAKVIPTSLALQWEERVEKEVPVRVELRGGAPAGTELVGPLRLMPPTLRLQGPQSRLDALQEVVGVPIDPSGLQPGHHQEKLELGALPAYIQMAAPVAVQVSFELKGTVRERRLRRISIEVLGLAEGQGDPQLKPNRVDLVLSGSEERLEELDADHLVPVVQLSEVEFEGGARAVPVTVRGVPDGLQVSRVEPQDVIVKPQRSVATSGPRSR